MTRSCSIAIASYLCRRLERVTDQLRGRKTRIRDSLKQPPCLRRLVAERQQRAERFALRRSRRGECGHGLRTRNASRELADIVAHLDDDSLSGLSADPRNSRQHRNVLGLDDPQEIINARARQDAQCDFRPHPRHLQQGAEQSALRVGAEPEQHMGILAYDHMREKRDGLADRRQAIKGRHRRIEFIADPAHIEHQARRILRREPAFQKADHLARPTSLRTRPRSAWQTAAARASAASAATGCWSFRIFLIINCTCTFSALPEPTTATLISRGAYSKKLTAAAAAPHIAAPLACPSFNALSALRFTNTRSIAIS